MPHTDKNSIKTEKDLEKEAYTYCANINDYKLANPLFAELLRINPTSLNYQLYYAMTLYDGTNTGAGKSRDLLIQIINNNEHLFTEDNDSLFYFIRLVASLCYSRGPQSESIRFYNKLIKTSSNADDFFRLGKLLESTESHDESIKMYAKAKSLNPAIYGNLLVDSVSEELAQGENSKNHIETKRFKIARYPETSDFLGDLKNLIKNHIAADNIDTIKFINKETKFFTMGSCFAGNLSDALKRTGYQCSHLGIHEHINSTFANKLLIDFLKNHQDKSHLNTDLERRVEELMPNGMNADSLINSMMDRDVFILTLGVAPVLFDRNTDEFVLPKPTSFTAKSLKHKFKIRTTSVRENVDNMISVIDFIRNLRPASKIIITVSPVPLVASFEYKSCVVADCLSKCTLRLAAHEIVNNNRIENIYYWPSFEIFRWAGSNASSFFAEDDGAAWHVSEKKVNETIQAFVEIFSENEHN